MNFTSMTRYIIVLLIAFGVTLFMIHDFNNKYHVSFGFTTEKSDF